MAIACLTLDAFNGSNSGLPRDVPWSAANVAGSPVATFATAAGTVARRTRVRTSGKPVYPAVASASGLLRTDAPVTDGGHPSSVLVVLVESFGSVRDTAVRRALFRPLMTGAVRERFTVDTGTVGTFGATVAAEIREMCGVRLGALADLATPPAGCLPAWFAARGFEAVAFHGFTRSYFGRTTWYPAIGFARQVGLEDVAGHATARCGLAVRGVCDSVMAVAVAEAIGQKATRPQFVYWLTVDSHMPVDPTRSHDALVPCPAGVPAPVCAHSGIVRKVLEQVAALATRPDVDLSEVVVVGDHAPPFFGLRARQSYDLSRVPFVRLRALRPNVP